MTFLLIEILVLLTLAAVLGALLMRWWLKRQFEDVTVEYSRLSSSESTGAAELTAWHFDPLPAGGWHAAKTNEELAATLRRLVQAHTGLDVAIALGG